MWQMIMIFSLIICTISIAYIGKCILKFDFAKLFLKNHPKIRILLAYLFGLVLFLICDFSLGFVNAMVCAIYMAMSFFICNILFAIIKKFRKKDFRYYYSGWIAIILCTSALSIGWWQDHNIWLTNYTLTTDKPNSDLKIVWFADSHIGTTFKSDGFAKHMQTIQNQNPDIVFIVGDYVDDETSKEDMIKSTKTLGELKTKYGIYFVFGNHDKGYYGSDYRGFSSDDLIKELSKNNIKILQDETVLIDNRIQIIGRKDYSSAKHNRQSRTPLKELSQNLDKNKYTIILDHQPVEQSQTSNTFVDLVLSGHTHGGQLFPFNYVGKLIGAVDQIYGLKTQNKTSFIVTSGISNWALKFKTGTKSEIVITEIKSTSKKTN
jgi:predicted MPP superfamily phosphohydrolase